MVNTCWSVLTSWCYQNVWKSQFLAKIGFFQSHIVDWKGQQVLTKFLDLESMISQVSKSVSTILIPRLVQILQLIKNSCQNLTLRKIGKISKIIRIPALMFLNFAENWTGCGMKIVDTDLETWDTILSSSKNLANTCWPC